MLVDDKQMEKSSSAKKIALIDAGLNLDQSVCLLFSVSRITGIIFRRFVH